MPVEICQDTLTAFQACVTALQSQIDELQECLDTFVELDCPECCCEWWDEMRRDVLRQATIMVYLADLNLACYPLSESAVLFIEP